MGLLRRIKSYIAPSERDRALRVIRAKYDAAITNDDNRRHWANADALSADASNSPEVRRILRNRSRYEVTNNSYAKGIVQTLAHYLIGTGPRLQVTGVSRADAEKITEAWSRWAAAVNLPGKLLTAVMAKVVDGESFLVLTTNPKIDSPVKLDVKVFEAEQVATPDLNPSDPLAVDGIRFDEYGNPTEYHLLKEHPGDSRAGITDRYDRLDAGQVIHYFRQDRPGQSRGIPDILAAIPLFAQLRRYTLAVIAAAETAADFAAVIYSDGPADPDDEEQPSAMEAIELEKRLATVLPNGWKLGQLEAQQPTTTYSEFKREILNEIARCILMPYNIAAADSSEYNYASGRLDHQSFGISMRVETANIGRLIIDRIFKAWLLEAALVEGFLPQAARTTETGLRHQWFWDGLEHVDPLKEATAQTERLANLTTSLSREYAKQGLDWESELRQIAKERELIEELRLVEVEPVGRTIPPDDAGEDEE